MLEPKTICKVSIKVVIICKDSSSSYMTLCESIDPVVS